MPIDPTGPLSEQLAAVEALLAATPAWQAWVGHAGDPDAARESVYVVGMMPADGAAAFTADELIEMRPFAVVDFDTSGQGFAFPSLALGQYPANGRILLSFEDNVPDEDRREMKDVAYDFLNHAGAVLAGMLATAVDGPHPVIQSANVRLGPRRASLQEAETKGDHMLLVVTLEVGLGGG